MRYTKRFDLGFIIFCAIFSIWLFGKSMGYDPVSGAMWIARNQVGDFGLHLSLIRSFSWGNNFPPQSPFYPGQPLTYHYLFDLVAGLIARMGVRIDIAINSISVIAMTVLLYFLFVLPQAVFGKNRRLGILSVVLFFCPGGWSFLDFFRSHSPSTWLQSWWRLPDYLHSGPFDGSIYSTYFTLNVFLNQRHLVAAFALSLGLMLWLLSKRRLSILFGILLGMLFWLHSLVFVASICVFGILAFRRWKELWLSFGIAGVIALPHAWTILHTAGVHAWWNPGFLARDNFGWVSYWWSNLGLMSLLIPIGVILSSRRERLLWWSMLPIFITANILQFSYRIEHNHSLVNYFFLIANIYGAYALDRLGKARVILLMLICVNGVLQFAAIKNDFHYRVPDAPKNALMQWIVSHTPKNSIFISPSNLMDPVTLSGRFTYVGPSYYLDVMGYNSRIRIDRVTAYLDHPDDRETNNLRNFGISYILIARPSGTLYFDTHTRKVFSDTQYSVYKL